MLRNTYWKLAIPIYVFLFLILVDSILAPFLESKMVAESYYFYSILRYLCHQLPSRCFWIFGSNMGLCSRCFGFFLGMFLIGLYLGKEGKNKIYWKGSIVLMIPMLIDVFTQLKGIRQGYNTLRFITGFLGGIGIGILVFSIYFKLIILIKGISKKGGEKRLAKKEGFIICKN